MIRTLRLALLTTVMGCSMGAGADSLLIAVAANFNATLEALGQEFTRQTGHSLRLTSASTGVHYAQIINGAPFDLFFSADAERPRLLEEQGEALSGTRFTYALGQLVLWSRDPNRVDPEGEVLRQGEFRRLAVADPETAPYGRAAGQVLERLGLAAALKGRLVTGTNISQAYQFVATGAAPLGLVAWSQLQAPGRAIAGSYWRVPEALYDPIEQQAVLLRDSPAARQFLQFMESPEAALILERYGYRLPRDQ